MYQKHQNLTKLPVFKGPGSPLKVKIFKQILQKLFFHEMTQLEWVRLESSKVDKVWTTPLVSLDGNETLN